MKGEIVIENWTEVVQNCDQEDLPPDKMTVCKNLRPVPGKLVKTQGAGVKLDAARDGMKNLVTYIESHISGGSLYIAVLINESTKIVSWYAWNGVAWTLIQNSLPQFTGNGTSWFHKVGKNPIIQNSNILRFLPGNVGKADGTNESKGLWLGYIDRDYFDELYDPGAAFYNYDCPVEKPDISFAVTQQDGDKAFSPAEVNIPITALSKTYHRVAVAGKYVNIFRKGTLFEIEGNLTNYGEYKVKSYRIEGDETSIEIDIESPNQDFYGDEANGFVKITTSKDTRYYKFSYIYDGIQESLLSDAIKVEFDEQKFLQLGFDIVKANHNKRITALNVYRSNSGYGSYRKIHTIDFLRKSDKVTTSADGFYSGERTIYLPDMNGTESSGSSAKIKLWNKHSSAWDTFDCTTMSASSTRVLFEVTTDVQSRKFSDYWDCAWQYLNNGADVTKEDSDSGFGGQQVGIIGEDLGDKPLAGGVMIFEYDGTKGDGAHVIIDANKLRAVHFTEKVVVGAGAAKDENWRLMMVENGLFFPAEYGDSNNADYMFFDTGLSEGAEHPLAGEVSIKVNGRFARLIGNRIWKANLVLDPGGDKEEVHEDWASYSPLLQNDVNPVSNIFTLPDLEGGPCTGLVDIVGNPVFFKPHAFTLINITDSPGTPSSWHPKQSPHNIGNIAEEGCLEALGKVYFVYYDGIYQITPSAFVEGAIETEKLKISWPIDNIFNAMTDEQKEAVKAEYNQRRGEVIFTITFTKQSTDYHQKWAFNISTGGWRELGTERKFDLMALDEKANVMVFDDDTDKVYSLAIADSDARSTLRIPVFRVTDDRPRPIRWVYVTYVCASDQALRLYTEHSIEPLEEFLLPATDKIITKRIRINRRAKKASLEITEDFSGYALVKETADTYGYLIVAKEDGVNPNTELHKIRILGDFDKGGMIQ